MEKYFLIHSDGNGQNQIKSYITELGAACLDFSSVREAAAFGESPHVILLFAGEKMAHFQSELTALKSRPFFAKIARILFVPHEIAPSVLRSKELEGEMVFQLPVEKAVLLSRLSGIKKRAHRRVFEILIRIQLSGGNLIYFGKSMDFSETGMAFESGEPFEMGQKVIISFSNPRDKTRIVLESEIVRKSVLSANKSLYGVRFENVERSVLRNLGDFVSGGSSI